MSTINIPDFDQVQMLPPRLDLGGPYVGNILELPVIKTKEDDPTEKKFIEIKVKVLQGPEQAEPDPITGTKVAAGRNITDRLYLVTGAYFKVKQLLVAAQLLARNDSESPLAKGQIPLEILVGSRFPFNIVASMKDGVEYRNIQYIW